MENKKTVLTGVKMKQPNEEFTELIPFSVNADNVVESENRHFVSTPELEIVQHPVGKRNIKGGDVFNLVEDKAINVADAQYSSAHGEGTITKKQASMVVGKYNKEDNKNLFTVGNGFNDLNRSNAFEVKENGDVSIKGDLKFGYNQNNLESMVGTPFTFLDNKALNGDFNVLDSKKNLYSWNTNYWEPLRGGGVTVERDYASPQNLTQEIPTDLVGDNKILVARMRWRQNALVIDNEWANPTLTFQLGNKSTTISLPFELPDNVICEPTDNLKRGIWETTSIMLETPQDNHTPNVPSYTLSVIWKDCFTAQKIIDEGRPSPLHPNFKNLNIDIDYIEVLELTREEYQFLMKNEDKYHHSREPIQLARLKCASKVQLPEL